MRAGNCKLRLYPQYSVGNANLNRIIPAEEDVKKSYIKNLYTAALTAAVISCLFSCSKNAGGDSRLNKVTVYSYDSFIGEWGPGPELEKRFEASTGYDLEFVDCGDAVQVLSRALLEKNAPQADVLVGIDNNLAPTAREAKILTSYKPKDADRIISEVLHKSLSSDWSLTPYDWSHFAMIYDSQSDVPAPSRLADLTKPVYAKKIILMDPRTSTPGLGFVAWTVAIFGNDYVNFWKALKPNILTVAPGWSSGYGLFTKGEAPLVISYTTSPAYHVEYDGTDRYKALIFDEGHIMQVEGAGIVRGAPNEKGAKAFIDFLISLEAQEVLPLTQWMYPANNSVRLPRSYQEAAPIANKNLTVSTDQVEQAVDRVLSLLSN